MTQFKGLILAVALALIGLGGSGCQTYNQQNAGTPLWKQGRLADAAKEFARKAAKEQSGKDAMIWQLEDGAAQRAFGDLRQSMAALDKVDELIAKYEEKAKIRISSETGALFSNQANLPYEGYDYDKVMVSTYKALNYLQLGEPDKARPEMFKAYQRQQDAVENNRKRIEKDSEAIQKAKADASNAKAKASSERAMQDPNFSGALNSHYSQLDTLKAYADFVNPFPVYLDGLYFLNFSTGPSDLERANKSFERVVAMAEDNKFVKADLETVQKALRGEPIPPITYVIFETGCAPWRDQIRIDLPLFFIGSGNVPYVGAAFPTLELDGNYLSSLVISAEGVTESTALVSSMDSVIGRSFKNELPTIITKTILSTTIKATAAYGVNQAADHDEIFGILTKIATGIAQAAVNISDTRTWTTLPKEFQICRIPTPASQMVDISAPGSGQRIQVKVEPNSVNLIYVKSINAMSPLIASQIKLK